MPRVSQLVTQSGADVATSAAVDTGLTADGKAAWSITGIECYWEDGASIAAADWSIVASVGTIVGETRFGSADEIARVSWGLQNTGGVAVAVPYDPQKELFMFEPRVTVQPYIYVTVVSDGTSNANDVIFVIHYDIVKLSDIEVLRLLAGGA